MHVPAASSSILTPADGQELSIWLTTYLHCPLIVTASLFNSKQEIIQWQRASVLVGGQFTTATSTNELSSSLVAFLYLPDRILVTGLQMLVAIYLLLHLSLFIRNSASLFTQAVCRPTTRLCVQRNTANTSWCYVPGAVDTVATGCTGDHLDLANVVKVHAAQDLSIAYYNGADDKRLGGADWPFPIGSGIYRLCLSGRAGEGLVQTLCFNVAGDNSIDGTPYCAVTYGPQVVSDGCYSPETLPTPTASSRTISNTPSPPSSPSSSKNSPGSSSAGTGTFSAQGTSASASTIIIDNSHKTNKAATIAAPVVLGIVVFIGLIVILVLWDKNQLLQQQVLGQGRDGGGRY